MKIKFSNLETIQSIINEYNSGESTYNLGKKYRCNRTTIADLLKKNDIFLRDKYKRSRRLSVDEDFFDIIDTEEKSYWLGFLFADGCIKNNGSKNVFSVSVGVSKKDKEIIYKFKKSLNSDHKICVDKRPRLKHGKIITTYYLSITSTKLALSLIKNGCTPRKSFTVELPQTVPLTLMNHFIRGYFDGDGSIGVKGKYKYPSVQICTSNKFGEQLKSFLEKFCDIKTNFCKSKSIYALRCSNVQAIKFLDYIYNNSHLYLERKFKKMLLVKKLEEERIRKRGLYRVSKIVEQLDLNFNVIKEYLSMSIASRETKIPYSSICSCCHNKYKTAGNYIWRFKNEI